MAYDKEGCRNKVIDVKEARNQIMFALPMVLTNVIFYLFPLVGVMFVGHLGELELAASTLANSWAGVTGLSFVTGLSVALETLCGQAFGAKSYKMLGMYLQTSCIISLIFSVFVSIFWWFTEPILVYILRQNPDVSKAAATYLRCLIPGIYAYGTLQNIIRFLQTQSIVWPLVTCSLLPLLLHIGLVYVLVHMTPLGFRGAPVASSISFWISVGMLVVYVKNAQTLKQTWSGLSKESLSYLVINLKLALSSAAMICLEWWAFEILILLAGLMPNSKMSTSVMAMCISTQSIAYMFIYGLSAATSTRVANELGARRPDRAKHALGVTLKLNLVQTILILIGLGFGRNVWARLFSNDINIIKSFATMVPLLCISIALDSLQGILSGVMRGSGWQNLTTFINLSTFIGLGIPIACLLAFKLHLHTKGLLIGLTCGIASQAAALCLVTCLKKWTAFELSDNKPQTSGAAVALEVLSL